VRLLAGARHETVGAEGHRRAAEEALHRRLVAVVADDGDLALVGEEEMVLWYVAEVLGTVT